MNSIFNFLTIDDLFILKETLKNEFICYYDEIQYNNLDWVKSYPVDGIREVIAKLWEEINNLS